MSPQPDFAEAIAAAAAKVHTQPATTAAPGAMASNGTVRAIQAAMAALAVVGPKPKEAFAGLQWTMTLRQHLADQQTKAGRDAPFDLEEALRFAVAAADAKAKEATEEAAEQQAKLAATKAADQAADDQARLLLGVRLASTVAVGWGVWHWRSKDGKPAFIPTAVAVAATWIVSGFLAPQIASLASTYAQGRAAIRV